MPFDFSFNSTSRHVNGDDANVSDNIDNSFLPLADVDAAIALRKSKRNCGPSSFMANTLVIVSENY